MSHSLPTERPTTQTSEIQKSQSVISEVMGVAIRVLIQESQIDKTILQCTILSGQ